MFAGVLKVCSLDFLLMLSCKVLTPGVNIHTNEHRSHDMAALLLSSCSITNQRGYTFLFSLMCLTKFDVKMTKMKQNYMVNMIMNVSGAVCQLIHYLPGKQGLAINLPWPALKSKQRTCIELFVIISFQLCEEGGGWWVFWVKVILLLRLQYNHTRSYYKLLKAFPPKHL